MKIAYFDCFSGASGDMILGSLVDAGLPVETLKTALSGLRVDGWDLTPRPVVKCGISGTRMAVTAGDNGGAHRHLSHVRKIVNGSDLPAVVKDKSLAIFARLAEAEARVHGVDMEQVHFHEVGAVDAIVDIVGSVAGLEALNVEAVYCSALHLGTGTVRCAHGVLPVPAPATAELVRGVPVYATGLEGELLTPTGAAILTTLAAGFGPMPTMIPETTGYGAGNADRTEPNLLRVHIGEIVDASRAGDTERIAVLETGIDDMNPQLYGHIMDRLLAAGARDVFLVPIQMKKNRPGTLLTVLCDPEQVDAFTGMILQETTTIGIRWRMENRVVADRKRVPVQTPYGEVRVKVASLDGRVVTVSPEYDDCKRLADEGGVPLKAVMAAAQRAGEEAG